MLRMLFVLFLQIILIHLLQIHAVYLIHRRSASFKLVDDHILSSLSNINFYDVIHRVLNFSDELQSVDCLAGIFQSHNLILLITLFEILTHFFEPLQFMVQVFVEGSNIFSWQQLREGNDWAVQSSCDT